MPDLQQIGLFSFQNTAGARRSFFVTVKLATRQMTIKGSETWIWVIGNLPETQLQRTADSIVMPLDLNTLLVKFNEQNPK